MSQISTDPVFRFNTVPDSTAVTSNADDAFNELTSEEFLEVIFAELTNQDPLAPNDTTALLEQISMIRSIESDTDLAERLEGVTEETRQLVESFEFITAGLSQLTELSTAGALIGREVVTDQRLLNEDGTPVLTEGGQSIFVDGVVTAILFRDTGLTARVENSGSGVAAEVPVQSIIRIGEAVAGEE
ncbi:MAG: flagellar hook capping FlgD N-terminal domain-containing protein [Planctomycetota bacterium]